MKRLLLIQIFLSLFLSSCMTTRVSFHNQWDPKDKPTYVDYFDYYWLGFYGQNDVDLQKVCMDQKIFGFKTQRTFEDFFLATITLGIYTPLTVQVWCGDGT